jgi:hypothetical protein
MFAVRSVRFGSEEARNYQYDLAWRAVEKSASPKAVVNTAAQHWLKTTTLG